ncbi:hypothetical protein OROMI_021138 [Orobanche minor]
MIKPPGNRKKIHWASWNKLCYPHNEGGIGCRDLNDTIKAAEYKMWWRFRSTTNIWSDFLNAKYCKSSGEGKVSFWHDTWCDFSPLSSICTSKSKACLSSFREDASWDRNKLLAALPPNYCDYISAFPTHSSFDKPSWKLSSNGTFSFKSAWESTRQRKNEHTFLKFCWNPLITPTISFFMVRVLNKWLPTSDCLTFPHLFLNGPVAIKVWDVFHKVAGFHRNDKRMKAIPFSAERVCGRIWNYLRSIIIPRKARFSFWKGAEIFACRLGGETAPKKDFLYIAVRWARPIMGWVKLNTDGAAKGNPGCAASGGIVRDHSGSPLFYFSEFLGDQSNTYAELHAIARGLELCLDKNFANIWVEVDSKVAIRLVLGTTSCHWKLQCVVANIRNFLSKANIRLSHIFREGNGVADLLANQGCDRRDFFCSTGHDLNGKVLGLIRLDKISYPYIRCKQR